MMRTSGRVNVLAFSHLLAGDVLLHLAGELTE